MVHNNGGDGKNILAPKIVRRFFERERDISAVHLLYRILRANL